MTVVLTPAYGDGSGSSCSGDGGEGDEAKMAASVSIDGRGDSSRGDGSDSGSSDAHDEGSRSDGASKRLHQRFVHLLIHERTR